MGEEAETGLDDVAFLEVGVLGPFAAQGCYDGSGYITASVDSSTTSRLFHSCPVRSEVPWRRARSFAILNSFFIILVIKDY